MCRIEIFGMILLKIDFPFVRIDRLSVEQSSKMNVFYP